MGNVASHSVGVGGTDEGLLVSTWLPHLSVIYEGHLRKLLLRGLDDSTIVLRPIYGNKFPYFFFFFFFFSILKSPSSVKSKLGAGQCLTEVAGKGEVAGSGNPVSI